jgi:hypothetical protein
MLSRENQLLNPSVFDAAWQSIYVPTLNAHNEPVCISIARNGTRQVLLARLVAEVEMYEKASWYLGYICRIGQSYKGNMSLS